MKPQQDVIELPDKHPLRIRAETAEAALAASEARIRELEAGAEGYRLLIAWLLGENGDFPAPPEDWATSKYKPFYWWRGELRKRALAIAGAVPSGEASGPLDGDELRSELLAHEAAAVLALTHGQQQDQQKIEQLEARIRELEGYRQADAEIVLAADAARQQAEQEREAMRAEREWQPRETAPKDGTWILGYDAPYFRVVQWSYNVDQDRWNDGEYDFAPTHWLPLPTAPMDRS